MSVGGDRSGDPARAEALHASLLQSPYGPPSGPGTGLFGGHAGKQKQPRISRTDAWLTLGLGRWGVGSLYLGEYTHTGLNP